jgi:hypothetical protein
MSVAVIMMMEMIVAVTVIMIVWMMMVPAHRVASLCRIFLLVIYIV